MSKILKKVIRRVVSFVLVFFVNKYYKTEVIEFITWLWNSRFVLMKGMTIFATITAITILLYFIIMYKLKGESFFDNVDDFIEKMTEIVEKILHFIKSWVCP